MSAKSLYTKSLVRLLEPLVRLALRAGIKLPSLLELLKQTYVDMSERELQTADTPITISRISLMTGVHRKDVTRILHSGAHEPDDSSLIARVLGLWNEDRRFQISNGQPRVLSYKGRGNEFASLVSVVSKELNPGSILAELRRVGAVQQTHQGLKLLKTGYVVKQDMTTALKFMSKDVNDLIETVQENVLGDSEARNLHLKTEYDNIPDAYIDAIRVWLRKEGTAFHQRVQKYLSGFDRDVNPKTTKHEGKNRAALISFARIEGEN